MYCIYLFNCRNTVEMNIYRIKTLKFNLLFMTKFMLTHSSCFFLSLSLKRQWFKQKLYLIHILKLNINRKKWSHDPVTFCLVFCFVLFFVLLMIMVLNKSSHPNNQFHSLTGRVEIRGIEAIRTGQVPSPICSIWALHCLLGTTHRIRDWTI